MKIADHINPSRHVKRENTSIQLLIIKNYKVMKTINYFLFIFLLMTAGNMHAQLDLTSQLTNPGFETGDTGWTYGPDGNNYWSGVNNDARNGKNGSYTFYTWGKGYGNYELSQTVGNLESGLYRVECSLIGGFIDGYGSILTTQRLFAGNATDGYKSQFYATADKYSEANLAIIGATETYSFAGHNLRAENSQYLDEMSVEVQITAGSLTFGIRTEGPANTKGLTFPTTGVPENRGFFYVDHFRLKKLPGSTSFENPDASDETIVYTRDNIIYVQSAPANPIKQVQAYDLQGRLIHSGAQLDALTYNFAINDAPGVYIVKVTGKNGIKCLKIVK
jgi:hypothetical protein